MRKRTATAEAALNAAARFSGIRIIRTKPLQPAWGMETNTDRVRGLSARSAQFLARLEKSPDAGLHCGGRGGDDRAAREAVKFMRADHRGRGQGRGPGRRDIIGVIMRRVARDRLADPCEHGAR